MITTVRSRQRLCAVVAGLLSLAMIILGDRFWTQRDLALPFAGVRVVDGAVRPTDVRTPTADDLAWLSAGRVPASAGVEVDLITAALLDLRTLGHDHGVAVAGWTEGWRYVWPRDSAFVAGAYARTGHRAEAEAQIAFLQRVQAPDGRFEARYRPDGSGPPDDRGVELDGSGWAIWALEQLVDQLPPAERSAVITTYRPLLDRSVAAVMASLDPDTGLPPPALDYWEVPESAPTLATAAVLLSGLRSAARLYAVVGDAGAGAAERADVAAVDLEDAVVQHFESDGYPRHPGGRAASVDLGVTFLRAPFAGVDRPAVAAAWAQTPRRLARPAGGLAPGGSWRNDGISWTPTTATYAVAASCADPDAARHWLGWLAAHRTGTGSLPEKVLADGRPASVAPLAWTAAAVVIAADQLERGCRRR